MTRTFSCPNCAAPLVAYLMSGFMGKQVVGAEHANELRHMIAERIARDGAIGITKSIGFFIATG